ncbi:MAG: creatininase family protein, partial [Spirochaetales bacterium]|nr:creatininase family protein [Spirochaetales bacterium]
LLSHGGIFIAGPVIRELNSIYPDIDVIKLDLVEFYLSKETNKYLECDNNLHAGEIESSLMVFLKKEYFRRDKVVDFIPDIPRSYLNNFPLLKVSPQGVWGKPSLATEEKGENLFNIVVKSAVEYLERFFLVLSKKT